jgi:lipopolysaccharide transport system ATP-binding protein
MSCAIRVDSLSKKYRIQHNHQRGSYRTLRDTLSELASVPLRCLRHGSAARTGDFWALRDVSFEVRAGEVVGIIGRNGAGKSTLLKIISEITPPTNGKVELYGRVGSLLEVGTGFHPELTGRENVYLNGSILGMNRREINRQFDEIVAFSGVENFLDTPVKRYSSGMKVRLAFAVAAHLQPEVLIIDEVLAVGDAEFQKKCLGKMQDVARGGRTVLFVSHNMQAIERLCDRVLWLLEGRSAGDGSPQELIPEYLASTSDSLLARYAPDAAHESADVVLEEAYITGINGDPTASLRFGEPFAVHCLWRHRRSVRGVCYSLRVTNSFGTLVFASNTSNQPAVSIDATGRYAASCKLDANVLSPGQYFVSLGAWVRPNGKITDRERCLCFQIESMPYDSTHRFAAAGKPIIAPRLHWSATRR